MKALSVKLLILGLLAAAWLTCGPPVAPVLGQALPPPGTWQAPPAWPPPGIIYLPRVEDLVFDLTNQARRARGLAPLSQDPELRQLARNFSTDMLRRRFFSHFTPEGVSFEQRLSRSYPHRVSAMGENIWSGSGYNPAAGPWLAQKIVADWLRSPGHRANLLSPDFTHLGVGISARGSVILVTQEFVGRPIDYRFGRTFSAK